MLTIDQISLKYLSIYFNGIGLVNLKNHYFFLLYKIGNHTGICIQSYFFKGKIYQIL